MLFLQACLLGVLLGIIYDVFRILRQLFSCSKITIFVQDLLFFSISTLLTFLFLVATNHGQIRIYLIAGELFGIWLYFQSLSKIIIAFTHWLIILFKKLFSPIICMIKAIFSQISRFFNFLNSKIKNIFRNRFFPLKKDVRIVYNKRNGMRKGGVFSWQRKRKLKKPKESLLQ